MVAQAVENKWIVKIGLNSSGDIDMRQRIADYFSRKLKNSGLMAEVKQVGIYGSSPYDVPVEISAPEEGKGTYYELASASDVERVVSNHMLGGRQVLGLKAQLDTVEKVSLKESDGALSSSTGINISEMKDAMNLLGIGFFLAISIVGGMGLGYWLDNMWDTKPLVMLIGLFVGIIIGIFGTYQTIAPIMKKK